MLNSRKACRSGERCEPQGDYKEVLHCAIEHSDAGTPGVAARIGTKQRTLADQINPNEPDWPSMRKLPGILAATKDHPILARYFAELQGGIFVALPSVGSGVESELFDANGVLMRQLSEAYDAIRKALGPDRQITKDEVPTIDREVDDIVAAALALKAVVHRVAVPRAPGTPPRRKR